MNRRSLTIATLSAAGLAAAGVGYWTQRRTAGPEADSAFWSTRFETPGGDNLALSTFQGKPLVVNFWATWCAPCVKEMPQLDRFHREHAGEGWQVLGVAVDRAEAVKTFLGKLPVGFPIALAGMAGADLARTLGNDKGGLPFTAVFDRKGRQVATRSGETSYDELLGWARQYG